MRFRIINILVILFTTCTSFLAQDKNAITVVGDSLLGKIVNGENIREVHGNVVMIQGDVRITCNKAIQYLARNEAELIGKVVVTQDSIIVNTDLGYYYGNEKKAFSKSGVKLFDGHINLKSKNGYYYFDEKKAYFYGEVQLNDSISTLTTDRLTYFNDEDKVVAAGNVIVKDSASYLAADSLIHLRDSRTTFAFKNVLVYDPINYLSIFGNQLEDYDKDNYSKIFGDPFLVKIDTTETGERDTLVISAKTLEAFGDSTKRLVATNSVKISRRELASINNYTVYYQNDDHLFTVKRENDTALPVLWNEDTQLVGDTINVFLEKNKLKDLIINSNASIISKNRLNELRFDQISGREIKMFFGEDGLKKTEIAGNVLSIYYLYEDGEPNGLLKSSSEKGVIYFQNQEVIDVRFYGNAASEYHPENIIEGKEKEFTIPSFVIIKNRPTKNSIIGYRAKDFYSRLIRIQDYGKKINSSK